MSAEEEGEREKRREEKQVSISGFPAFGGNKKKCSCNGEGRGERRKKSSNRKTEVTLVRTNVVYVVVKVVQRNFNILCSTRT